MEEGLLGNKNQKSLALISSPLQLISLKEFENKYKGLDLEIFVFITEDDDTIKRQIKFTSEFLNLNISNYIVSKSSVIKYLKLILMFSFKQYNLLILGSYFNSIFFFTHLITKFKKLVFVDDGSETFFIKKINLARHSFFGKLFNWRYPINSFHFSFYEGLDINYFDYNDFSYLKNFSEKKPVGDFIVLLGSNFVESNQMSFYDYNSRIEHIKKKFNSKKIIYIPHRREYESNYVNYGLEVVKPDTCFEIFLLKMDRLPTYIIGFFSTALITSKMIIDNAVKTEILNYPVPFKPSEIYDVFLELFDKYNIKSIEKYKTKSLKTT
jgi:hypothetical protein